MDEDQASIEQLSEERLLDNRSIASEKKSLRGHPIWARIDEDRMLEHPENQIVHDMINRSSHPTARVVIHSLVDIASGKKRRRS